MAKTKYVPGVLLRPNQHVKLRLRQYIYNSTCYLCCRELTHCRVHGPCKIVYIIAEKFCITLQRVQLWNYYYCGIRIIIYYCLHGLLHIVANSG